MRKNKKLTKHFNLQDFTIYELPEQGKIELEVPQEYVDSLQHLCEQVLEPFRLHVRRELKIVCGFVTEELNEQLHGVGDSRHLYGEAADIEIPDRETGVKWFNWMKNHCPFDQIIWEHKRGAPPCIHVSCKRDNCDNRGMALRTPF